MEHNGKWRKQAEYRKIIGEEAWNDINKLEKIYQSCPENETIRERLEFLKRYKPIKWQRVSGSYGCGKRS